MLIRRWRSAPRALEAALEGVAEDSGEAAALKEKIADATARHDAYYLEAEGRRTSCVWLYLRKPSPATTPASDR